MKTMEKIAIIASVVVAISVIIPSIYYTNNDPKIDVSNGTNTIDFNGMVGHYTNDTPFFNQTWANATISQPSYVVSTLHLFLGPGEFVQELNVAHQDTLVEMINFGFYGDLAYDLHPSSIKISLNTSGTSNTSTVNLEASTQHGTNISYSDKESYALSFSNNGQASSQLSFQNEPHSFFPSTVNKTYSFSYSAQFYVTSPYTVPMKKSFDITITLEGLSEIVSDTVSLVVNQGGN